MRTIIAGSRSATLADLNAAMLECPWRDKITLVISGCARGADLHGENWASLHQIPIERYPANWKKYGKSAGFIRNEQMAQVADALIAIWDGESRGTANMINHTEKLNLPVHIHYF